METSLHRELKTQYSTSESDTEVKLGRFRIDAVRDGELIEIQHGSLAAIRSKIASLVKRHRVRVVKPIIVRKRLVKRSAKGRRVVDRRMSPKRGSLLDVFHEMVYFCRVFPHKNLTLEVPLVIVEEWRFPGHGRRRRRRAKDHQVEDQKLVGIEATHEFQTRADFLALLPRELPVPFTTRHLAEKMDVAPWFARRIAYSLREMGGLKPVGKQGNAIEYRASSR